MSDLLTLQDKFQKYLMQSNEDIYHSVISTSKVPAEVRLAIYKNAYQARLTDALAVSYPALKIYLGDEQFTELCYTYIDAHPSFYRSIRWFGDKLAPFLSQHAQYKEFPFLSELAQLEWTMALVFDAPDDQIFPIENMATIPPDAWIDMKLQAHPSIYRLNLSWNVVSIWQAILDNQTPDEPQQSPSLVSWILWRNELTSQFSSLPIDEAWAIDAMLNHATFGEICEGLCQWIDEQEVAMRAATLLKSWIISGLITQIIV